MRKRKLAAPVEKRLDQTYAERKRKAVAEAEGTGRATANLHETKAPAGALGCVFINALGREAYR